MNDHGWWFMAKKWLGFGTGWWQCLKSWVWSHPSHAARPPIHWLKGMQEPWPSDAQPCGEKGSHGSYQWGYLKSLVVSLTWDVWEYHEPLKFRGFLPMLWSLTMASPFWAELTVGVKKMHCLVVPSHLETQNVEPTNSNWFNQLRAFKPNDLTVPGLRAMAPSCENFANIKASDEVARLPLWNMCPSVYFISLSLSTTKSIDHE